MFSTFFYLLLLSNIFINRVLLNEYYNQTFNDGYFYLLFCKDFEQHTFSMGNNVNDINIVEYTDVSFSQTIIKYYMLGICVYLIYKTVFSIRNYK